jgi:GNAT superfamily N-acetyltransferase
MPVMRTTLTLREAARSEAPLVAKLLSQALSRRTADDIIKLLDDGGFAVLASRGSKIVGVGTAAIAARVEDVLAQGQEAVAAQLPLTGPVAVMQSAVVIPSERRHGVGTALTEARIRWMASRHVRSAFSSAWVMPDGTIPAKHQLESAGFRELARVANYWTAESIARHYVCSVCGSLCRCAAALYARAFTRPDRSTP